AAHRCPHVRAHTRGRLAGAKVVGEVAGVVGVDAHLAGRTAQPCEAATLVATTRTTLANMRDVDARGRRFAVVAGGNVVAATHRRPDIRAGVGAWLTASAATTDGFVRAAVIRTTIGAHGTDEVEVGPTLERGRRALTTVHHVDACGVGEAAVAVRLPVAATHRVVLLGAGIGARGA